MLTTASKKIIESSKPLGWILEPDAKAILKSLGFDIPENIVTRSFDAADQFREACSGPVVAKAVSKKILHKTEHQAVVTDIVSSDHLKKEMERLQTLPGCEAILVEEMIQGIEMIIGAKNDFQFGPVIVLGIGGTSVEIYKDTAIRMAPLKPADVLSMVNSLKAKQIIFGYRGKTGVNMAILTNLVVNFSRVVMDQKNTIESIDLNPVLCTEDRCVIADARMMLTSP